MWWKLKRLYQLEDTTNETGSIDKVMIIDIDTQLSRRRRERERESEKLQHIKSFTFISNEWVHHHSKYTNQCVTDIFNSAKIQFSPVFCVFYSPLITLDSITCACIPPAWAYFCALELMRETLCKTFTKQSIEDICLPKYQLGHFVGISFEICYHIHSYYSNENN